MDARQGYHDEYSPFAPPSGRADGRTRNDLPGRSFARASGEEERGDPDAYEAAPDSERWHAEAEQSEEESQAVEKTTHNPACTASGIGIRGTDDRQPVADSTVIPCRWICQLWIRQRDSNGVVTESGATGVLVSPRHVLTVAHAIAGSTRDSRNQPVTYEAIAVRVTPARDGANRPFGTIDAKLPAQLSPGWSAKSMPPHQDYALLTLDKPIGDATFKSLGGAKLCYWGAKSCGHRAVAARVPPDTLQRATAFTAGYPKDRGNGERPMRATGVLSHVVPTSRLMHYTADACQGQSGSPVWMVVDGERRLVGMLVKVLPATTLAVRVTREFCTQLRKWLGKESDAFQGEVAVTGTKPDAREWNEESADADSEAGAWIHASSPCACRRAARAAEAEWEGTAGDREIESLAEYDSLAYDDLATEESLGEAEELAVGEVFVDGEGFAEAETFAEALSLEDEGFGAEAIDESEGPADPEALGALEGSPDSGRFGEEEGYTAESFEEPASEDEAPLPEWVMLKESEESEGWVGPGESAGATSLVRRPRPAVLVHSWGEGGDVEAPEQQAATPPPTLRYLAFMSDVATPLDPGFYNASGQYQTSQPLQAAVEAVGKLRSARNVQIALVDLSGGVGSPVFAGVRHTTSAALGSVGKLAPMYAAFQLQADLRRLKAAASAVSAADVWTAARARWTATQKPPTGAAVSAISGHLGRKGDLFTWKGQPVALRAGSRVPDLQEIFGDDATVTIRSTPLTYVTTTNPCDEFVVLLRREFARTGGKRDLRFMQRMRMMIGMSDNHAAGSCIGDLGYAYMASLMVQSGLWHPARGGGIWLASNYAGGAWGASPLGGGLQHGTAGSVATFMTLLAQDKLVDASSSAAMRAMLLKRAYPGAGTRSPVQQAIGGLPGRASKVHSKLGLLGTSVSDAAIVERTEGGKRLHYAVAVLNAPGDAAMTEIAAALDDCVRRAHGLP